MTRREISAGGVVYCDSDSPQVVLIRPKDRDAWTLPKGLIEQGEAPERAAEREVLEETGLSGEILTKIDTIRYSYTATWETPPVRVFKIVVFYLIKYVHGDPFQHDWEVERVEWFPIDKAIQTASYAQEKTIIRKARHLIPKLPEVL